MLERRATEAAGLGWLAAEIVLLRVPVQVKVIVTNNGHGPGVLGAVTASPGAVVIRRVGVQARPLIVGIASGLLRCESGLRLP